MNVVVEYCSGKEERYRLDRFMEQAETILDPNWTSYGLSCAIIHDGGLLKHLGLNHDICRAAGIPLPVLKLAIAKQSVKAATRSLPNNPAPAEARRIKRLIRI